MKDYPKPYAERTLKSKYKLLGLPEETISLLHRYFDAFSNFYHLLPLRDAYKIISEQNPNLLSFEDFIFFSEIVRREQHNYFIDSEADWEGKEVDPQRRYIIIEYLLVVDINDYYNLKHIQKGKPLYIPPKDELLKYDDEYYYEKTPQALAMQDFLKKRCHLTGCDLEDIMIDIRSELLFFDSDICHIFDIIERYGIVFTKSMAEEFVEKYYLWNNNIRMPANRGYTPVEIRKKINVRSETASFSPFEYLTKQAKNKDIPKNALCPCGSGKKYKRCCGKNAN
ncbi:MAG TPA: hypothetical protein DCY31_00730 [Ruminococcaceae bacterium]|nr:hypothetical protein [Oscillospiraceae bacterium]